MKQDLGAQNLMYPMPVALVGAMVEGRPNVITIAHVGIWTLSTFSLGIHKSHYTNQGIEKTRTFSVNIPSQDQVVETDYCGIKSGRKTDKSALFDFFYGVLETAPMIRQCPVNMECRLLRTVDMETHDVFVGEVVRSYADDSALTDGHVDLTKVQPMLFDMTVKQYFRLGEPFAQCWGAGKAYGKTE